MDVLKYATSPLPRYCVGFMFNPEMESIILIRKNRPNWQVGKLNGVGGHISDNEAPIEAMRREFKEEAGVDIADWKPVALLECPDALVWFFWAKGDQFYEAKAMTDEGIEMVSVRRAMETPEVLPNLPWLIQMTRSFSRGEKATCFVVTERHM
jgi:8-oxo-dGTP diphosphatase